MTFICLKHLQNDSFIMLRSIPLIFSFFYQAHVILNKRNMTKKMNVMGTVKGIQLMQFIKNKYIEHMYCTVGQKSI